MSLTNNRVHGPSGPARARGRIACHAIMAMMISSNIAQAVSLIERSPFVGPDFDPNTSATEVTRVSSGSEEFEFHGVYELDGSTHVLLKAKSDGSFSWYTVGMGHDGIIPKSYDADSNELVIVMNNSEVWLTLQEMGEFKPMPIASVASSPSSRTVRTPTPVTTRTTRISPVQRPSLTGESMTSNAVSSLVSRLPRSPTSGRSRLSAEQIQPIINASSLQQPRMNPDESDSPETKAPRSAPSLPFDLPSPPKGPGG